MMQNRGHPWVRAQLVTALLASLSVALAEASPPVSSPAPATAPSVTDTSHRTYGEWRSSRIGGGGYLQQVVFCTSDARRMYLAVDVGGLYRSDDAGRTWHMLHGTLPARAGNYSVAAISVHPGNADELVIATGSRWAAPEGVYLSEDGGRSWRQTLAGAWFMADGPCRADGLVLARSPADPSLLLAGSIGSGVYRSEDAGRSWTLVGLKDLYPSAIVFDQRDPQHIWLCAIPRSKMTAFGGSITFPGGLYESRDSGRNWQQIAAEAPREFVQDPLDPARVYGLFRDRQVQSSSDDGRTWTPFSQGLAPLRKKGDYRDPGLLQALATGPDFVLVGASDGTLYRLHREQNRWEQVQRESVQVDDWFGYVVEPPGRRFGSAMGFIAVDPRDPNHWCFTDWYALYQSFDAGHNWQLTIDGIEATVIHVLRATRRDDNLVHLGMGDNGYFRSMDAGESFQPGAIRIGNNIKDIAVSPVDSERLYAVGPDTFGWRANQVYISDDGGVNWRRSSMRGLPDMSKHRCNTVVAGSGDADEVWLAVSGAIGENLGGAYRSSDGGQSWQWFGQGLPADKPFFRHDIWVVGRELAVGSDGSVLCASHATGRIFRLDRSSGFWQPCPSPGKGRPHDLVSGLEGGQFYLAMQDGGLYVTADDGHSWKGLYGESVYHLVIDEKTPGRLAGATDDGVILSEDAGQHWRALDKSLPYRVARLPMCFAGNRLVLGTAGCGVFWIQLDEPKPEP